MNTSSSATPSAATASAAPSSAAPASAAPSSAAPSSAASAAALAALAAVTPALPLTAASAPTLLAAISAAPAADGAVGAPAAPLVLVTPQGEQTLQTGQAQKVQAEPGRQYKLLRAGASADNVIATEQGADLLLRYQDGTSVTLLGFYSVGPDGGVCSVLLAGEDAAGYVLKGEPGGGIGQADGTTLVYAHGARDAMMEMAQGHGALGDAFTSLGAGPTVNYLPGAPATPSVDVHGPDFQPALLYGLLGLGAAALAGGGGGGAAAVVAPPVAASTAVNGAVIAGAVVAGNDLVVTAYTASGTLLASAVTVNADGTYTFTLTSNYVGAVLLKLSSSGPAPDYFDEASGTAMNLTSSLFSVVTMAGAGQAVSANITPLTTLAAYKIGLASTQDGISGDASSANVAAVNNAVAKAFGLTTGNDSVTTLLATPAVSSSGAVQTGNAYGNLLAAISGAELVLGQTTAQVLATLAAGTTFGASGVSFSNDAAGSAAKDILAQGASQAIQAAVLTSASALPLFASIFAGSDPAAAPQALIFGDAINLNAPVNVGNHAASTQVSFKLSAANANFTLAAITVTGGTLGALSVDAVDPSLYHATFTPAATDALTATISINAGAFANAGGVVNLASNAFTLHGDTLAPAAPGLVEQAGAAMVLGDGVLSLNELAVNVQVNAAASGSAAQVGDNVALLLNGAAFATPMLHTVTASDIAAGSIVFNVARSTLGADGAKALSAVITDVAGNIGAASSALSFVLNSSVAGLTLALSVDSGASSTDQITNSAGFNATGLTVASATAVGFDHLQYQLDSSSGSWITGAAGVTSVPGTAFAGIADGAHTLYARQVDSAGTVSAISSAPFMLDTTAPAVPSIALTTDSGASSTDGVTNSAALSMGALEVASTSASGFEHLQYQLDSSSGTWISGVSGATSVPAAAFAGAAAGAHTAYVSQVDLAGNVSAAASLPFTLENAAPAVTGVTIGGISGGISATNLGIGDSVAVSVVMNEALTVTGIPTYAIALDSGAHVASYVSGSGSNTLVFQYTVASGDNELSGGISAGAGALVLPSGAALVDLAGNAASLVVPAVAAGANSLHINTSAPLPLNAAVLDGQTSVDPTSNLMLNFGTTLGVVAGGSISLVNDANSSTKAGFGGESASNTQHLYFGAHTDTAGVTTVQTYSSPTTQTPATLSGSLSIVDATGVVTVSPLYDMDLSNNYHVEIAANSFTNTGNGLANAAFGALTAGAYALNFSTVSPSAAGSAAVAMASASALAPSSTWIDITGLGDLTAGVVANVASASGASTYVIANKNAVAGDTVFATETTNVLLPTLRVGDMLYVDNSINGRISSLGSGTGDATWTANAANNGILLDLPAHTSFDANIGIPVAAFANATIMNARIDALVANSQLIVG